jgi:colanic acid/amylovoran biosynthesis glycosyltransferase
VNRLAYVLGTFPALTETFIAGEVEALRGVGVTVELFALRWPRRMPPTAPGAALAARTCYSPSLLNGGLWRANGRALRRGPRRYLTTAAAVLASTALNPIYCLKSLAIFLMAAFFAERMREQRIRHVHGHWANYPATAAYVVSRLLDIPFSFTAHAYDATLIRSMLREKIRRAALVVTCTRWNRELLCRLEPAARAKIFLSYHGVTLETLGRGRPAAPHSVQEFQIVSCGSLYPRKGFRDLLQACRILKQRGWKFRCRIIGEGPQRGQLERYLRRHGLRDTVELLGARPHRAAIDYYRTADLFVLPCVTDYLGWSELLTDPILVLQVGPAIPVRPITDGIPNVLVEAMAMGVPVVSTPVAGIPELIEDGRTGVLVPEGNPTALATAIERLFDDPEQRRRLAAQARQRVLRDFDRSKNINDLVQIFSSSSGHGRPFRAFDDIGAGAAAR